MKDLTSDVLSQQIVITCRCLQDFRPLLSPCPAPEPTAKETITIPQEEPTPAREPLTIVSDWIPRQNKQTMVLDSKVPFLSSLLVATFIFIHGISVFHFVWTWFYGTIKPPLTPMVLPR